MRPLKLKVRNIASLKGEHEINFGEILKQSPLFAITGETGSGKSSLLNALSLALYGQIYKKNVNQIDVVTLGEKEGLIELIFQVKGKYYLADWRVRVLKQNGEPYSTPQTPTRNLYVLEGTDFSSPKTITNISVNELLNLDFDQFTKCIILNQGEFARFLTSSFTDRKEILEKLYPGELLESMGKVLKSELDALLKSKEALEIELQTLRGDGVSGDILKEQKKEFEETVKNLETIFKHMEEVDYHFVGLHSNHEKFAENNRRIANIKKEMSDHTTRFNLLLKNGEVIQEKKEIAQRDLETKLPGLQVLLTKEETLKNTEAQFAQSKLKQETLESSLKKIVQELDLVEVKLKTSTEKLQSTLKELTLPLENLKLGRLHFDEVFDLFSEKDLLEEELKGKKDRLKVLETQGKELKLELEGLEGKVKTSPETLKAQEIELEKQKKNLKDLLEQEQRSTIKVAELEKNLSELKKEEEETNKRTQSLLDLIQRTKLDLSPIETTLKLQEVLGASEVCVTHAIEKNESECPVCKQDVGQERWKVLRDNLAQTDLKALKKRSDELSLLLVKSTEEEKLLTLKLTTLLQNKSSREKDLTELKTGLGVKLPSLDELEKKLSDIKKELWEIETVQKEITKVRAELQKAREQYLTLKNEITGREKKSEELEVKISSFKTKLTSLVPDLNKDTIALLKKEGRLLSLYLDAETLFNKVSQDKKHQEEQKTQRESDLASIVKEMEALAQSIQTIKAELTEKLQGQKASELIQKLNQVAKLAAEAWSTQEQEQKKQELQLKEFQSRLYELDKLTKDYDLQFTKELHTLKDLGGTQIKIDRTETKTLLEKLSTLNLELNSPSELLIPLKDYIKSEKEFYKESLNQARMSFATVKARLEDWEKLQDKILINELKAKDVRENFERRERLYEVLGKDELRTFVLSLVEENLIVQTNQELQKLCQGRYEILHQSRRLKMAPDFFILDKFREGGLRKISTLSGGETFMVSLAMALGLAEMTRGQAEIDSLFIDEGFGTLDQDSLEDVLDMLQQIQNRGLMVGIISHIKALTHAIPVNLVLNKRQDGTSTVFIRTN